ncbi:Histone acetyltransferase [Nowakowskiella sp. JEL0078]|nr:Histone acetyltransferase [Nowakowskiella sp. JEL0078]
MQTPQKGRGSNSKNDKTPSKKGIGRKSLSKFDSFAGSPGIPSRLTEDLDELPLASIVSRKRERSVEFEEVEEPEEDDNEEAPTEGFVVEEPMIDDDDVEMRDAHEKEEAEEITTFSKEKELEKLRTSGSMTQCVTEIARVKNIKSIIIGHAVLETWYFSPYPESFTKADAVYICEFCLEPYPSLKQFERHRTKCTLRYPPGTEIYRDPIGNISFFEIDGRKQRRYCRNLCLLSKLFLDHKTLYYDVDPFIFYLMTRNDNTGCHLLGYFSKEKLSAENYNVACILTLPQYQRMGYGKLLIAFSYELTKIERKTGSPEKPLSDLGLLSYRSYWTEALIERFMTNRTEVSVSDLSEEMAFTPEDILSTLVETDMLRVFRGGHFITLLDEHIEQYNKSKRKPKLKIDPILIDWKPPRFHPNQLRFL